MLCINIVILDVIGMDLLEVLISVIMRSIEVGKLILSYIIVISLYIYVTIPIVFLITYLPRNISSN